jgi:hypothetical protein
VRGAKVIKRTRLRKSELVDCAIVREDWLITVHIVWRAKLPVGCARIAAGDAVAVTMPGPPDRIPGGDIYCRRCKHETIQPYRDVKNLTATGWHAADCRSAVLIYNPDDVAGSVLRLCCSDVSVAGCRLRRKYERKHRGQPK